MRQLELNDDICITKLSDKQVCVSHRFDGNRIFNFDAVMNTQATQRRAYDVSARRVLKKVLDGFNGCVFAYGQTGSGKTYTMEGIPSLPGVIPRLTKDLFKHISQMQSETDFVVKASYVEVYQEKLRDLLHGVVESGSISGVGSTKGHRHSPGHGGRKHGDHSRSPQPSIRLASSSSLGIERKNCRRRKMAYCLGKSAWSFGTGIN